MATPKKQIYNSINEWYHPEIDYYEMLEKFQWTENDLRRLVREKNEMREDSFLFGDFPQEMVLLFQYCKAWEIKDGKEIPGKNQLFQFWNKQYLDLLALQLQELKPKLILDICAGDGMLAKALSDRGLPIKATDDYSWTFGQRFFDVEKLDYKEAIRKYRPDVIIGCWMPLGTDWTPFFRRFKSTKHYLIIGEVNACCGGNWDQRKGWKIERLECSRYGLCRTDYLQLFEKKQGARIHPAGFHSASMLFSRI